MRLRTAAEESRVRLLGESARPGPSKIEIELIPAPAQYRKLEDENSALRLRVAELESALASVPRGALDGAPSVQPLSSDGQSAAPPAPDNVIPLVESREQRIARLRRENGDAPQSLRSAYSVDAMSYRDGGGRFDFPSH